MEHESIVSHPQILIRIGIIGSVIARMKQVNLTDCATVPAFVIDTDFSSQILSEIAIAVKIEYSYDSFYESYVMSHI